MKICEERCFLPLISSTGKSANDKRFFVEGVKFSLVD
jgi:hypothetical protein